MFFNNAIYFQYELDESMPSLSELLAENALKPCPPHARFIQGWLPLFADCFAQEASGSTLICMGKEERILPSSVIKRELEERVEMQETQLSRPLKRSEKSQMAEEIEFELLPKAFCLQKRMYAILDKLSNHLIINSSSTTQAAQLVALLRKSVPGIKIEPLSCGENLAFHFSQWITQPSTIPPSFQLASDCLLFSPDNEKKRFNCKGYELPADEILSLLNQGLLVSEISIQWNERIQCTLTQDLIFKRIKCLDYLLDDFNHLKELDDDAQQRDAALVLLTGELRSMMKELFTHLSAPAVTTHGQTSHTESGATVN